jgi:RimJ/RimL family protein N-acetyltransferase
MQSFRARVMDDFGPQTQHAFVDQMLRANPAETWGVYRDDELGGLVWVARLTPVVAMAHTVFQRSFWGREITRPAVAEAFRQTFAAGVEKIAASVFADNHQIRALARDVGMREEGQRRAHTRRGGKPIDLVDYGILRGELHADWNGRGPGAFGSGEPGGRAVGRVEDEHDDEHADLFGRPAGDTARCGEHAPNAPAKSGGGVRPAEECGA